MCVGLIQFRRQDDVRIMNAYLDPLVGFAPIITYSATISSGAPNTPIMSLSY